MNAWDAAPLGLAWRRLDRPGFEHLRRDVDATGVRADDLVVVGDRDGRRRLRYHLALDADDGLRTLRGRRDTARPPCRRSSPAPTR